MSTVDAEQFGQLGAGKEQGDATLEPDQHALGDEVDNGSRLDQRASDFGFGGVLGMAWFFVKLSVNLRVSFHALAQAHWNLFEENRTVQYLSGTNLFPLRDAWSS